MAHAHSSPHAIPISYVCTIYVHKYITGFSFSMSSFNYSFN